MKSNTKLFITATAIFLLAVASVIMISKSMRLNSQQRVSQPDIVLEFDGIPFVVSDISMRNSCLKFIDRSKHGDVSSKVQLVWLIDDGNRDKLVKAKLTYVLIATLREQNISDQNARLIFLMLGYRSGNETVREFLHGYATSTKHESRFRRYAIIAIGTILGRNELRLDHPNRYLPSKVELTAIQSFLDSSDPDDELAAIMSISIGHVQEMIPSLKIINRYSKLPPVTHESLKTLRDFKSQL